MGPVAKGKVVRGFIMTKFIDDNLKYAVKMINNIQLLEYNMKFALKTPLLIHDVRHFIVDILMSSRTIDGTFLYVPSLKPVK